MCVFALEAEKETPSKALFVDYANLPDAVPEHVFPQHFGMEAEVAKVRGCCCVDRSGEEWTCRRCCER